MDKDQHFVTDEACGAAAIKSHVFVGHALAPENRSVDLGLAKRDAGQPYGVCRIEDSFGSWLEADC
jgi:hypothetical protein